ncbi:hypothetical protein BKA66DRAFT_547191 [Pyrenochaeta sp. MPI-SDFR-AT-0127]|nr:hypothetical protein BKA66DRAFT_547191 [Pyrenochaeta sp. MPI-SDFR-AT-0127]
MAVSGTFTRSHTEQNSHSIDLESRLSQLPHMPPQQARNMQEHGRLALDRSQDIMKHDHLPDPCTIRPHPPLSTICAIPYFLAAYPCSQAYLTAEDDDDDDDDGGDDGGDDDMYSVLNTTYSLNTSPFAMIDHAVLHRSSGCLTAPKRAVCLSEMCMLDDVCSSVNYF